MVTLKNSLELRCVLTEICTHVLMRQLSDASDAGRTRAAGADLQFVMPVKSSVSSHPKPSSSMQQPQPSVQLMTTNIDDDLLLVPATDQRQSRSAPIPSKGIGSSSSPQSSPTYIILKVGRFDGLFVVPLKAIIVN